MLTDVLLEETRGVRSLRTTHDGQRPAGDVGQKPRRNALVVFSDHELGDPGRRIHDAVGMGYFHAGDRRPRRGSGGRSATPPDSCLGDAGRRTARECFLHWLQPAQGVASAAAQREPWQHSTSTAGRGREERGREGERGRGGEGGEEEERGRKGGGGEGEEGRDGGGKGEGEGGGEGGGGGGGGGADGVPLGFPEPFDQWRTCSCLSLESPYCPNADPAEAMA